jgi:hypothetical protein
MQLLSKLVVELQEEEVFVIPENCWAYVEEVVDGIEQKRYIQTKTVQGKDIARLVLVPRVAGG